MNVPVPSEQSLRLEFALSDGQFGPKPEFAELLDLEAHLEQAIAAARAGELDGHEVGGGAFVVFTYGPDADALFQAVATTLLASPHASTCTVVLRHGPPGSPETRLVLSEALRLLKVGA